MTTRRPFNLSQEFVTRATAAEDDGFTANGPERAFSLWTVYDSPEDYPGLYVARRFELDKPTSDVLVSNSLDVLRALLPPFLHRIPRSAGDVPCIVETWI